MVGSPLPDKLGTGLLNSARYAVSTAFLSRVSIPITVEAIGVVEIGVVEIEVVEVGAVVLVGLLGVVGVGEVDGEQPTNHNRKSNDADESKATRVDDEGVITSCERFLLDIVCMMDYSKTSYYFRATVLPRRFAINKVSRLSSRVLFCSIVALSRASVWESFSFNCLFSVIRA